MKIRFSIPVEWVETAILNPRVKNLKVGLQITFSTRSTVTSNQILKRVATKNKMPYSKQNTADATRVIAALASLGLQTSHSLQSLCFVPCNAIYYFSCRTKQNKVGGKELLGCLAFASTL